MTSAEIVDQLRLLGSESYKNVLLKHGIKEPLFGVKVEELKKFQKQIKTDYQLALELYDTGIYDAMYLAGLIADDARMTKKDLRHWLANANCNTLAEYTVPWVASGNKSGWELAMQWIGSKKEREAAAGWSTLSSLVAVTNDSDLDMDELRRLLQQVNKTINSQPNRTRYCMNGFIIAVGSYVKPLTDEALRTGKEIGQVYVDMEGTACKIPFAPEYIEKARKRGTIGKKRKTAKC